MGSQKVEADEEARRLCPSSSVERATVFLGMVMPSGKVAFMTPAPPVDRDFLDSLTEEDERIEERFRLAGPCVEEQCAYWSGRNCRLGVELSGLRPETEKEQGGGVRTLPACGIRKRCRWFAENGARACGVCPYVVTDNTSDRSRVGFGTVDE